MVGYSRHMERNDAGTLARLREIREQLIDPKIAEYGGHVVKTAGDGMLLEFSSADAALRCAVDVQRAMKARNESQALDERIEFRIGINLGDIIVDGDDIAGDGVNVAARLEALAEPGGICISGSVRDQVHGNVDVGFDDIGEQQVKNIMRSIRVFAVALDPQAIRPPAAARPAAMRSPAGPIASTRRPPWLRRSWTVLVAGVISLVAVGSSFLWWTSRTTTSSEPPPMSVGVLPLVAPIGDLETAQRAESITQDLTAILSRTSTLIRVIPVPAAQAQAVRAENSATARTLDVRYLVEGEVRPHEDVTAISLRLVNGATREQLWSEGVSLAATSAPAERLRSLRAVVWHLSRALFSVELRRVAAQSSSNATPLDTVLRALALDRTEPDTLKRIRAKESLLDDALRRDPNLVPALVNLAGVLDQQIDNDVHVDRDRAVQRMDDLTSRAVQLNDVLPTTWVYRSMALMYMGQWNASLEASAKAIRLEPDSSGLISNRAALMAYSGRPAEALTLIDQAIALDPPGGYVQMRVACEAHLLLGQYEQAITACEKANGLFREDWIVNLLLVAASAHHGDTAKAAAVKAEVLRRVPGYTIATLKSRGYSVNPDYIRLAEEQWYSGLRKAGFPEN
ncbi:MAG TPA: adenylate/guanylate cyclase domain-containing protein [Casimicrobiaceae bacterium]|nr:adenylate/guanylate cyclase domain-containing protein [Casimicrobiaceae bacterium]